jgi:thymidylate synthase (FAD)
MKIVQPSIHFRWITPDPLKQIETAARLCYKSEDKICEGSDVIMAKMLLARKHYAMFDHASMSYHVICDRGVSHEFVRHRLFGFAQESTRYCNYYGKQMQFIQPPFKCQRAVNAWDTMVSNAEIAYSKMIEQGETPQIARSVLPTCLKTELIVTGDFTEWRHFFKLRTALDAHPQMREIALMILNDATMRVPVVFDEFL